MNLKKLLMFSLYILIALKVETVFGLERKQQLSNYLGTYKPNLFSNMSLVISIEQESLAIEAVGKGKFKLVHEAGHRFQVQGVPIQVTFVDSDRGKFESLEFNQKGRVINFIRQEKLAAEYKKVAKKVRPHGLSDAILMNDLESAKQLIQAGIDVSELDTRERIGGKNGRRPLNWASLENNTAMIKLLLNSGADVNATNLSGFTPLHHAAEANATESARLLIKLGADSTLKTKSGRTALEIAAIENNQTLVKLLQNSDK